MKSKVKRFTDRLLEDYSENEKKELISFIDAVIKRIPKSFKGAFPSYGICSVIIEVWGSYDDGIRYDLRDIVVQNGMFWERKRIEGGWRKVKEGVDWGFVWKPGSISPRIRFLKELKAYIEDEKN